MLNKIIRQLEMLHRVWLSLLPMMGVGSTTAMAKAVKECDGIMIVHSHQEVDSLIRNHGLEPHQVVSLHAFERDGVKGRKAPLFFDTATVFVILQRSQDALASADKAKSLVKQLISE